MILYKVSKLYNSNKLVNSTPITFDIVKIWKFKNDKVNIELYGNNTIIQIKIKDKIYLTYLLLDIFFFI